jgi:uncharacterized membrane protein YgcG
LRRFVLSILLFLAPPALRGEERVVDFASEIRIEANGWLEVTERIEVEVEGRQIRRGILRDFPTDYRDRYGARVRVPFEVWRVTQDGLPARWARERLANGARIRIGDPRVLLARGRHVYEITYRTARQLGFFESHDELYWNVNGNGWTFAMDRVAARIVFPAAMPASALKLQAYTGPQGARGRHYEAEAREGGVFFRTTRRLQPYEGLTIVVAFPKGVVAAPGALDRARWMLEDNLGVVAGAVGLLLLAAFLGWRWMLVGRDPRAGPKFPRYDPPPGVGAAGVRYVDRMAYDDRCFAAALVGLAQRGYLRIRQIGDRYTLERTGKPVTWLPAEQRLANGLFHGGAATVSFGREHDPALQSVRNHLQSDLQKLFSEKLFSRNQGSFFAGVALAAATAFAMFVLEAPPLLIGVAAAAMVAILLLFWRLLPAYSVQGRKLQDAIEGLKQYLGVAEADELRRMKAPPQTGEEFARLLPYALALDVERTWADRFAATLGAAAVAAAVADYYSTDSGGGLFDRGGIGGLTDSISSLGDTVAAASTPPGSSSGSSDSGGGGGGGGSGGGGGGGGGSGW